MATLRDWARLGLMLAHDGRWNGEQIVPKEWLIEATTVPVGADYLRNVVGGSWSYGYQVWLLPGGHRAFALMGVYGQHLFVDPDAKLVMVQTAVETKAQDIPRTIESFALWRSLGTSLSAPAAAPR
jgi:CubicO group peptidase (beta-lactamase class C family)